MAVELVEEKELAEFRECGMELGASTSQVPLREPSKSGMEKKRWKLLLYFESMNSQELILYFIRNTEEVIIKVVDTPSLATSGKWI